MLKSSVASTIDWKRKFLRETLRVIECTVHNSQASQAPLHTHTELTHTQRLFTVHYLPGGGGGGYVQYISYKPVCVIMRMQCDDSCVFNPCSVPITQ